MLHFAKRIGRHEEASSRGRCGAVRVEELHGRVLGMWATGQSAGRRRSGRGRSACGFTCCGGHADRRPRTRWGAGLRNRGADRADGGVGLCAGGGAADAETRGLIGTQAMRQMKPNAVLINLGRGAGRRGASAGGALARGAIRARVLTCSTASRWSRRQPFWSMDNVLLSPHTADRTATWLDEAMELFLENYRVLRPGKRC